MAQKYHWTRRVRSVLSSISDLVADWLYYRFIVNLNDDRIPELYFANATLAAAVVSTIVGVLNIWTVGLGRERIFCKEQCCGVTPGKFTHLMETLFEDIPQIAISAIVSHRLSAISPRAVFNLTTSGFNFMLDFLDIFEPDFVFPDNDPEPDQEAQQSKQYRSSTSSNKPQVY